MDEIYFSTTNDDLVTGYDIYKAVFLMTGEIIDYNNFNTVREYAKELKGIKREIKHPSVNYLLDHGKKVMAIKVYRDIHNVSLTESKNAVETMIEKRNK